VAIVGGKGTCATLLPKGPMILARAERRCQSDLRKLGPPLMQRAWGEVRSVGVNELPLILARSARARPGFFLSAFAGWRSLSSGSREFAVEARVYVSEQD
jgi:hypothetical protein